MILAGIIVFLAVWAYIAFHYHRDRINWDKLSPDRKAYICRDDWNHIL